LAGSARGLRSAVGADASRARLARFATPDVAVLLDTVETEVLATGAVLGKHWSQRLPSSPWIHSSFNENLS